MRGIIIRIVVNAVALWVAAALVSGVSVSDSVGGLLIAAVIFGLVNAIIKPIVKFLTCPFYLSTLGLFTFVVNALMLMLTGWISQGQVEVEGFVPALLGGIVISVVSFLLSVFIPDDGD